MCNKQIKSVLSEIRQVEMAHLFQQEVQGSDDIIYSSGGNLIVLLVTLFKTLESLWKETHWMNLLPFWCSIELYDKI